MGNLKISHKIYLYSFAVILAFGLLVGWVYGRLEYNLHAGKGEVVQRAVESVWGVADHYVQSVKSGALTEVEGKEAASEAIRHIRFEGENYFWINDLSTVMVMHPIKPELEGKNLYETRDPNGKALFREMVDVTQSQGEGFVEYFWPKAGSSEAVSKISFVKLLPEWGWVIGAGLYQDDIDAQLSEVRESVVVVVIAVILAALILAKLLARGISGPIRQAIEILEKVTHGDTSETMPVGKAVNCSAAKECGKKDCPSYGKVDPCWLTSGSMAMIKHCPRALEGQDCRTCDLFGAKTVQQQLGSIVMAISTHQRDRAELAMAIGKGDLTREIPVSSEKDGLGKALEGMRRNLLEIIGAVQATGEEMASGSLQVADSSQSLSQGATESAASLEQISASMRNIASQTSNSDANAAQANHLAGQAQDTARKGNVHMQSMVAAMEDIKGASQDISKIIKVIDEIAFQTNLLALNAAVEAARAGQHGKGFAVVAEEVRNLAARSAKAAQETSALIEGSVEKAQNGAAIADRTAAALDEIVVGVSKVTDLVGEIASASNDQAQGIGEVNVGLSQIDQVTQRNTANAEEGAAAAEELSAQADQLHRLLSRFETGCGARSPGHADPEKLIAL